MSNDLATLNSKLAAALRDPTYVTWTSSEMNDLVTWAVARLYPRFRQANDPSATTIALIPIPTDGTPTTFVYAIPGTVRDVYRVDQIDSSGNYFGEIGHLAWQITGDYDLGTAKLRLGEMPMEVNGTVQLYGWLPFDTSSHYIPDRLVPLVISLARAEGYRRMGSSREQFKAWMAHNQMQNVTVNELLELIREAQNQAVNDWKMTERTISAPVPGRRA